MGAPQAFHILHRGTRCTLEQHACVFSGGYWDVQHWVLGRAGSPCRVGVERVGTACRAWGSAGYDRPG